jgi:type II secretory pathway component PulJ
VKSRRFTGFTLLEVLVAATIMFAVLSLSALAVKTFRESSAKAERRIYMLGVLHLIVPQIQHELRLPGSEAKTSGQGSFGSVSFNWQASLTAQKAAPVQFNPDTGQLEQTPERFRLYVVDVQLQYQSLSIDKRYTEVVW